MDHTSVKDALNKANLAIRKYFSIANEAGECSPASVFTKPREDAIKAIKEFADAKRANNEMTLTPFEEKCLGVMDAADTMAMYKTDPKTVKHECKHCGEGCTCGQYEAH